MTASILPFGTYCLLCVDLEVNNNLQKMTSFPGFWRWEKRDIRFRPTANNIRHIGENWPDAIWHQGTQHYLDAFIKEQQEASLTSEKKQIILEDDGSYIYKTDPMDHQRQLFLLSRDKPSFAFFMEQGTGKTKPDIDTAAYQYSQGWIDAFIVIAPNGVHTNWEAEEIPKHMPDWCPHKVWVYSSNLTKKKQAKLEELLAKKDCLKVVCFNMEGFTSDKAKKILERILRSNRCKVTIDESQGIKNHSAERTKYLTKSCKDVFSKRILTGTSVTKGIQDLYAQFGWLDKDILGFDSFYTFRNNFCKMGGFEMKQIVGYKNIDELVKLIDPYSFRVTKDQCLDLPPKVYKRHYVELSKEQRRIYDKLRQDYYASLEGYGTVSAPLAITRMLRLQQVTCGWFPSGDDSEMIRIPGDNPKLEAALEHVKAHESPSLVWARFRPDIELIHEELCREHGRHAVAMYRGGMKPEDKTAIVKAFQDGQLKAVVCSKAAARGLTLTACENPFYHSQEYDLEIRQQSEDRCHRKGTVNSVTYTDCVANKTGDMKIIRSLIAKKAIADLINQDGPSFFMMENGDDDE